LRVQQDTDLGVHIWQKALHAACSFAYVLLLLLLVLLLLVLLLRHNPCCVASARAFACV
jgi:hypothetical protein